MTPATLLRAAALLEYHARQLQRASTVDGKWTADALNDGNDREVEEMREVAAELRKGAA